MKFAIGEKIHDLADIDKVSLKDLLLLQQQTAESGRMLTMEDIRRMQADLNAIEDSKERGKHPDAIWLLAVGIWAARRLAGEDVTFLQAIDFPMSQLTFIKEPQDRKKPDPTRARRASGRVGKAAAPPRSTRASKSRSTGG